MKNLFGILLVLLLVGIPILVGTYNKDIQDNLTKNNNEVIVPIMEENGHLSDVSEIEYNSNPPTSGPHFSDWHKEWKFYKEEQPIGGLIHNMEHGGVVLFYSSSIEDSVKDDLESYVEGNFKIIASPKYGLGKDMVLAAWGVYEEFDYFDEASFDRFYKAHLNKAPETVYP